MSALPSKGVQNIRFVFLDREGVLDEKPPNGRYVTRWCDFHLLSGVEQAIQVLNRCGCKVIVVTNQRCVALGMCSEADVIALHNRLRDHLARHGAHIDAFYFCPHENDSCECRKPKPGMFERAFRDFPQASPENSIMVGDSLSDIKAGTAIGMKTVLIRSVSQAHGDGHEIAAEMANMCAGSLLEWVRQTFSALD